MCVSATKQQSKYGLAVKVEFFRSVFLIYLLSLHRVEKLNGFFVFPSA